MSQLPDVGTKPDALHQPADEQLAVTLEDKSGDASGTIKLPALTFAATVLAAHRLLCDMNEANRAQFQNVVEAFERELGKP